MVYARETGDRTLTFDFAEGLLHNNLLLVDRETDSVWSQLDSKAIAGPMEDTPMEIVPSIQSTWGYWRKRHPDTRVVIRPDRMEGRPYVYRTRKPGAPPPGERPKEHNTRNLGLGIVLDGQARFFPLSELSKTQTPLEFTTSQGRKVSIHQSREGMTAWAEDSEGELLPAVLVYQDGWKSFYPGSSVFVSGR